LDNLDVGVIYYSVRMHSDSSEEGLIGLYGQNKPSKLFFVGVSV